MDDKKQPEKAQANGHLNGTKHPDALSPALGEQAAPSAPVAKEQAVVGAAPPLPPNAVSLAGKTIVIATPCHSADLWQEYVLSLARTQMEMQRYGVNVMIMLLPGESVIQKARNALASRFLKTAATHLLFIDADMGWEPEAVLRLLASGKPIAGVPGRRKCDPPSYCLLLDPNTNRTDHTGLMRAHSVGTGFMLIERSVLERMALADPENYYTDYGSGERIWNFFENRVFNKHFWSEDYVFCLKWNNLGGEVWVDAESKLKHFGTQVFEGAFKEEIQRFGRNFVNHNVVGGVPDILGIKKEITHAPLSGELRSDEHLVPSGQPDPSGIGVAHAQPDQPRL